MKKIFFYSFIILSLTCLSSATGFGQKEFSSDSEHLSGFKIASYLMDVRLDTSRKCLNGDLVLNWKNTTDFPATDLQFHLYYNAWRNNKSSFLNSVRYRKRDLSVYKDDEWAYCDIKEIRILKDENFEDEDLFPSIKFIQPNDGNPHDRTVLKAPLRRSVFPGESISVAIKWESKIPRTFARTGNIGDFYFLAQWFPKIGVFEDSGLWNCHQFIQTEFYADYGTYDVKLTVPSRWIVGATGREIGKYENRDGTTTHHYYQDMVHDFTWVTAPYFSAYTTRFDEPGLPPVDMRLLLMPDHENKRERYFTSTAIALKYYGEWFGAYPYGHVTIVDPAYQSRTGGMEYPTLFTGGTRWLSPPATRSPESVTIHEAGHQFWYGLIGNNEFEYAWIDEGFNTYTQHRIFKHYYPLPVLTKRYFEGFIPFVFDGVFKENRIAGADKYSGYQSVFKKDPMGLASWKHGPGSYGANAYDRPALMLQTLENYLGWDVFRKAMSVFFQRWKYKHPKPADFFATINEVSGQDMDWFFQEAYYKANVFDYGVGKVWSAAERDLHGYPEPNNPYFEQAPKSPNKGSGDNFASSVYIRRWGGAVFPVEIKITFNNGEEVLETWDGKARWTVFKYHKKASVESVEVDPEHKLALDINYSNNSWLRNSQATIASWKWTSKWMIWLQNWMEMMAFFI